jgi:hypothetical protein
MLGVGEREGEIEVLDIDEKGGTVKLSDYGVITNVPFAKLPSTPSGPVNTAGIPTPHPGIPAHLGGNPAIPQRTIPGLPTRTLRTGNGNNQGASTTGAGLTTPGLTGGNSSIPGQFQGNSTEAPMTPEEQVILMEAQREQFKSKGDPRAALLPPTELTSPEDLKGLMNPSSPLPKGLTHGNPQLPQ